MWRGHVNDEVSRFGAGGARRKGAW
jgi:hypothetical protein